MSEPPQKKPPQQPSGAALARTRSEAETEALGERLGAALAPGDVLGLVGPLGAGKTRLVHGIARGFARQVGARRPPPVCSPSYTVINTYELGEARIHHIDLYRLGGVDDLESTGYWDALEDPDAVSLVEWLDQVEEAAPGDHATLHISLEDPPGVRRFDLRAAPSSPLAVRLRAAASAA